MVSDKHCRTSGVQPSPFFLRTGILNLEPDAGKEEHGPFEGSCGVVLAKAAGVEEGQQGRGQGTVGCAEDKGEEGSEAAGVKRQDGEVETAGEEIEGVDEQCEEGDDGGEVEEEGRHFGRAC